MTEESIVKDPSLTLRMTTEIICWAGALGLLAFGRSNVRPHMAVRSSARQTQLHSRSKSAVLDFLCALPCRSFNFSIYFYSVKIKLTQIRNRKNNYDLKRRMD